MSEYIQITWTSGSMDEARKVARYLVQERYVACAQITPWVESIYMWDNRLETTQESKVVMKTLRERFDEIKGIILDNSSYEVPEITWSVIEGGNEAYLAWVQDSSQTATRK